MAVPASSAKLEKDVQEKVVKWARGSGWIAIKLWGFSNVGLPDYLFLHDWPVIVFIEFKKPGGRMGPLQERWRKVLAMRGFPCYTVEQAENGIHHLQTVLESKGLPKDRDKVAP